MHLPDNDQTIDQLRRAAPMEGFPPRQISANSLADMSPTGPAMDHLDALEAQSIYIFREAFARLKKLALVVAR